LEGPELVPRDLRAEELNLDDLVLDEIFVKEPEPVLGISVKENVQNIVLDTAAAEIVAERVEAVAQGPVNTLPQAAEIAAAVTPEAMAVPPMESKAVVADALLAASVESKAVVAENVAAALVERKPFVPDSVTPAAQPASSAIQSVPEPPAETVPTKKPLFWSAGVNSVPDAEKPGEADRSHVPPMLRGLRKCEACGFPVSAGRVLCVECEEKKWRGQLRVPQGSGPRQAAMPAAGAPVAVAPQETRAFAAAQSAAVSVATPLMRGVPASAAASSPGARASAEVKEANGLTALPLPATGEADRSARQLPQPAREALATRDFVFSAGIGSSQSWLSANKYVIGVVLLVAAVAVTAVFLLR
jgi:hypothetical protein